MQYVGTNYGQYISNELQNKIIVNLFEPFHTPEFTSRHDIQEQTIRTVLANIYTDKATQRTILEAAVAAGIDDADTMKLPILENDISQGDYKANVDVPIIMTELKKTQSNNEGPTYRDRNAQLTNHRGKGFSLIIGQCTQLLQDKMNHDTE